jgi:hypothetical protein
MGLVVRSSWLCLSLPMCQSCCLQDLFGYTASYAKATVLSKTRHVSNSVSKLLLSHCASLRRRRHALFHVSFPSNYVLS